MPVTDGTTARLAATPLWARGLSIAAAVLLAVLAFGGAALDLWHPARPSAVRDPVAADTPAERPGTGSESVGGPVDDLAGPDGPPQGPATSQVDAAATLLLLETVEFALFDPSPTEQEAAARLDRLAALDGRTGQLGLDPEQAAALSELVRATALLELAVVDRPGADRLRAEHARWLEQQAGLVRDHGVRALRYRDGVAPTAAAGVALQPHLAALLGGTPDQATHHRLQQVHRTLAGPGRRPAGVEQEVLELLGHALEVTAPLAEAGAGDPDPSPGHARPYARELYRELHQHLAEVAGWASQDAPVDYLPWVAPDAVG